MLRARTGAKILIFFAIYFFFVPELVGQSRKEAFSDWEVCSAVEYWDHAVLGSRAPKSLWFAWSNDVTKGLNLGHGRQKSWLNKPEDTVSYEEKVNIDFFFFLGGYVCALNEYRFIITYPNWVIYCINIWKEDNTGYRHSVTLTATIMKGTYIKIRSRAWNSTRGSMVRSSKTFREKKQTCRKW